MTIRLGNTVRCDQFHPVHVGDAERPVTSYTGADATFTGTVVLPTNTSIGSVTKQELSHLAGVTSSIQAQLSAAGGGGDTVAFRVYHNEFVSPSTSDVEWKFADFDVGGDFTLGSGNGFFTVPSAGVYKFHLRTMASVNDNTEANPSIHVNGTLKAQATWRQPAHDESGHSYISLSTLLQLAANDVVTARFGGSNYTAKPNSSINAEFSGFKV